MKKNLIIVIIMLFIFIGLIVYLRNKTSDNKQCNKNFSEMLLKKPNIDFKSLPQDDE